MMFSYETLFRGFHTGRLVRKKMWRDTPHTPRAIGGSYENSLSARFAFSRHTMARQPSAKSKKAEVLTR